MKRNQFIKATFLYHSSYKFPELWYLLYKKLNTYFKRINSMIEWPHCLKIVLHTLLQLFGHLHHWSDIHFMQEEIEEEKSLILDKELDLKWKCRRKTWKTENKIEKHNFFLHFNPGWHTPDVRQQNPLNLSICFDTMIYVNTYVGWLQSHYRRQRHALVL